MRASAEERFWRKVKAESAQGCWIWTGAQSKGYGYFFIKKGKQKGSHVWVYERFFGTVSKGFEVHHTCENPLCVNWSHLKALSKQDHLMLSNNPWIINKNKTHCSRGHPFSKENTYIKKDGCRDCKECHRIRHRVSYT